MPRQNPNLSVTLPRNFVFHYKDGEAPKTPEQERPEITEAPALNRNPHSARPALASRSLFARDSVPVDSSNAAISSTESDHVGPSGLMGLFRQPGSLSLKAHTAQTLRRYPVAPKTPPVERSLLESALREKDYSPPQQESFGDGCSDSSDATDTSDDEDFDTSTICTSPGYAPTTDPLDPFKDEQAAATAPRSQGVHTVRHGFSTIIENTKGPRKSKRATVPWTTEMDNHLLAAFQLYCNDPTNTPFKHIPGCAPPAGVCHRVATMAKKLWRGGRSGLSGRHFTLESMASSLSGSSTANTIKTHYVVWPKTGASTRRHLRSLCKRQYVMPSHYTRLLQSRSPEPMDGNTFARSRKAASRTGLAQSSSYHTNGLRFSIATSSATTMQPNAPIASLTRDDGIAQPTPRSVRTAAPWASPAPIPSDLDAGPPSDDTEMRSGSPGLPRLASPFTQTWGPAATYSYERTATEVPAEEDVTMTSPKLAPAFPTFPYPATGTQRRRALGGLERALNTDSDGLSDPDLPGWMQSETVRRARLQKHQPTVDRASIRDQRAPIYNPTATNHQQSELTSIAELLAPPVPRLASPFAGIGARPSRSRRTLSSSNSGMLGGFPSIEEMMGRSHPSS